MTFNHPDFPEPKDPYGPVVQSSDPSFFAQGRTEPSEKETEVSQESAAPSPDSEVEVTNKEAIPALSFKTPPHNVTVTRPMTAQGVLKQPETLSLPAASNATQSELIRTIPNVRQDSDAKDVDWAANFYKGQTMTPVNGQLDDALSREGSDWHQGVQIGGELLRSTIPKLPVHQNAKLEGNQAYQAAMTHMQLGDIFFTGLWNSGFWVTFKPAPDPIWITINRILGTEVMGITRETYGLLHSTATSLAISTVISLLIPYVYSTTVNPSEMSIDKITEHMSSLDEQDFIWGFIASNFPRGVNIERSCIADPSKCRHVIAETMNIRELQLVDLDLIPEPLRQHMRSRKPGSMSLASVKEYREKLLSASDTTLKLTNVSGQEATLSLSVPTSLKKAIMSDNYVADIHQDVMKAVTSDTPSNQRAAMYDEYNTATEMRLYQHWVKEIHLDTNVIDDPKDIANILGSWTRDNSMRVQFFEGIKKFINSASISVLALEAAICPNCGSNHSRPEQQTRGKTDCIPLDMLQLFSDLAEFKQQLNSAR